VKAFTWRSDFYVECNDVSTDRQRPLKFIIIKHYPFMLKIRKAI